MCQLLKVLKKPLRGRNSHKKAGSSETKPQVLPNGLFLPERPAAQIFNRNMGRKSDFLARSAPDDQPQRGGNFPTRLKPPLPSVNPSGVAKPGPRDQRITPDEAPANIQTLADSLGLNTYLAPREGNP